MLFFPPLRYRMWFIFIFYSMKTVGFNELSPISDFFGVCCAHWNDGTTDKKWVPLKRRSLRCPSGHTPGGDLGVT